MKKKLLFLISVLFVLTFTACGKDNSIELTLDNYEDYLDVSLQYELEDAIDWGTAMGTKAIDVYVYESIGTYLSVQGKSTNFNYNDVEVTVRVTCSYCPYSASDQKAINKGTITQEEYFYKNYKNIDFDLSTNTDIVGNGNASEKLEILGNNNSCWIYDDSSTEVSYEVVEIKGTVTPTY